MMYCLCLQLKNEVMDLTMQRDLAQSQIKDMLQVVGDDMSSTDFVSSLTYSRSLIVVIGIPLILFLVQTQSPGKFGSSISQITCAVFMGLR